MKRTSIHELEYVANANGTPKAVILSLKDWDRIRETLGISSSKSLTSSLARARKQLRERARLLTHEEIFGNL